MGSEECFYTFIEGRESRLLEIPLAYNLDEWTFYYDWGSTAKDIVDTRTVEFNARYMEKSLFCLTCHSPVTGRPSRLCCLIGIVAYIQKCPDVEFMRATNYVECYWG